MASEDAYIIRTGSRTPCPTLAKPCLTLSEYAHRVTVDHVSPNTTLEFLPGQHHLDSDITVFNVTSFTMLGSTSHGESMTTITCTGPAAISFMECQEVRLLAVKFVHCGTVDQPALTVNSIQYFVMINCSLTDSRSTGILACRSSLALYSISLYNSTGTGLIVMNGVAEFTGTTWFSGNGNPVLTKRDSFCFADSPLKCAGGFAAVNTSTYFLGMTVFEKNAAEYGGAIFVSGCTAVVFQGFQLFENNQGYTGGGVFAIKSNLKFLKSDSPVSLRMVPFTDTAYFTNNSAFHGGGIHIRNSSLICDGAVVLNTNTAKVLGGGIFANLNSSVSFSGSAVLSDNIAVIGGGIDIEDSSMTCAGTISLHGNIAVHQGGGIASADSSISFSQGTILKRNTADQGGGMDVKNSVVTCDGTIVVERNKAVKLGGGIIAYHGSSLTLHANVVFRENSADSGGGINMQRSNLVCDGNVVFDSNRAESKGGGVFMMKTSSLRFNANVDFVGNRAFYGGGIDILQNSSVSFSGITIFINNTAERSGGGFRVSYSSAVISGNTTFLANSAPYGGGMNIVRSSIDCSGTIAFTDNSALVGGGIRVYDANISFNSSTLFDGNTAQVMGGGIFVSCADTSFPHCGSAVERTVARSACYISESDTRTTDAYQIFQRPVKFVNNRASIGGGIGRFSGNLFFLDDVVFTNNSAVLWDTSALGLGGGVFSHSGFLSFLKETNFTLNTAYVGGGLYASRTTMTVEGSLNVRHNHAVVGGGFYFESGSKCWLTESSSLQLSHNYAGRFGGAVYARDDPFFYCIGIHRLIHTSNRAHCLFQPTMWPTTANIQLTGNYAQQAGSAMYGGIIDECKLVTLTNKTYGDDDETNAEFFEWMFQNASLEASSDSSFISSDPTSVCLCIANEPHCNIVELNMAIFPGGTLHISVVATGQRNGTVPSVITATFADSGIVANSNQDAQLSNKTCTTLHYRLSPRLGHNTSTDYSMFLLSESPCHSYRKALWVRINLLPCPSGFELSQTSYTSCICDKRIQQHTNTCDIDAQTILRHGQYWIGWDTTSDGAILHPHCPFDYCRSGNTSFPMNDTDRQCQHNRAGLLCGGCEKGYSIGFGSSQCLECSSNSFLSLVLVFLVAGAILVVFLLVFNLTVAMGTINGLIFYANIVAAKQAIYFPKNNSEGAFLRVFIAWINLDLGIETCFFNGMDMYSRMWMQFAFPLYIWTLVGIVIVMCHYFSWATRMFGRNPVAVLATLFLLSYTKLLRTIIAAMSFTYLDYPDNPRVPVWVYDGNVGYLKGKHIALFLAALLVLAFLFLPYTLVILFGQWIEARSQHKLLRWISDYRVKPFLDAYHGPLITAYRYWPGLLLAIRALLLLVFAFNALGNPNIDFIAIIILVLGLISLLTYTGTVYSRVHLYLLELSFLINSLLLAAAHGMMAPVLTEGNQLALTYTSVGIAFTTFGGILVYHTVQVRDSRAWSTIKLWIQHGRQGQPTGTVAELNNEGQDGTVTNRNRASPTVGTTTVDLRELLLEGT